MSSIAYNYGGPEPELSTTQPRASSRDGANSRQGQKRISESWYRNLLRKKIKLVHHSAEKQRISLCCCGKTCKNIKLFMFVYCCMVFFQSALSEYFMDAILHIQRQYSLQTKELEFVDGVEKIGFVVGLIFIAYYGNKSHKPIIIAVGAIVAACGTIVVVLPHFIFPISLGSILPSSDAIPDYISSGLCQVGRNNTVESTQCDILNKLKRPGDAFSLLCTGKFLVGLGSSFFATLGFIYLEESIDDSDTPLYFGIILCMRGLGDIAGALFSLWFAYGLSAVLSEPLVAAEWVAGGWWLGLLVCAGGLLLPSIPLWFYPQWIQEPQWLLTRRQRRLRRLHRLLAEEEKRLKRKKHQRRKKRRREREARRAALSGGAGAGSNGAGVASGSAGGESNGAGVVSGGGVGVSLDPAALGVQYDGHQNAGFEGNDDPNGDTDSEEEDAVSDNKGEDDGQEEDADADDDVSPHHDAHASNGHAHDLHTRTVLNETRHVTDDVIRQDSDGSEATEVRNRDAGKSVRFGPDVGNSLDEMVDGHTTGRPDSAEQDDTESLSSKADSNDGRTKHYLGRHLQDMPQNLWFLLSNPRFSLTVGAAALAAYLPAGHTPVLPRLLAASFPGAPTSPFLTTGITQGLAATVAPLLAAVLVWRLRPSFHRQVVILIVLQVVAAACLIMAMFLDCAPEYHGLDAKTLSVEEAPRCRSSCDCSGTQRRPVCGANNTIYPSACHAGCRDVTLHPETRDITYSSCMCGAAGEVVSAAQCGSSACAQFIPYMLLTFAASFCESSNRLTVVLLLLRVVTKKLRSLSLGFGVWLIYVGAYIPGRAVFNAVAESNCLLHETDCYNDDVCWYHDLRKLNYLYNGVSAAFQAAAAILFGVLYVKLVDKRNSRKVASQSGDAEAEFTGIGADSNVVTDEEQGSSRGARNVAYVADGNMNHSDVIAN